MLCKAAPAARFLTLFFCLLLLCAVAGYYLPALAVHTAGPPPLFRLHVIARSDDPADQALKLAVRDAVLAQLDPLLAECGSPVEASAVTAANLDLVSQAAADCLRMAGCPDPVRAEVGRYHFPRKIYGQFVAPAGEYLALRVIIAEGRGANWWCVLYPPLCLSERTGAVVLPEAAGERPAGQKPPVEIRSKLWDWLWGTPGSGVAE
ncbi:MAG: stage II sporulation protein R [Heliobacteriaceae bacterium]|nr:stage II sporulation protein R [Heliobacteriaceae bacterium]